MNEQQVDDKIRRDASKVKKLLITLVGDGSARFSILEDNVTQAASKAKEDLTLWVEDGVSQLSEEFDKLTGEAVETVVGTAATVKKDVGRGLSQYNTRAQEVADKIPGGFAEKAAKYSWVAITMALFVGFLLGILIKPGRHHFR